MLKRYIGSAEAVTVVLLGESYGIVEQGEALVIPDELAAQVAWPESDWADVPAAPPKTKHREES